MPSPNYSSVWINKVSSYLFRKRKRKKCSSSFFFYFLLNWLGCSPGMSHCNKFTIHLCSKKHELNNSASKSSFVNVSVLSLSILSYLFMVTLFLFLTVTFYFFFYSIFKLQAEHSGATPLIMSYYLEVVTNTASAAPATPVTFYWYMNYPVWLRASCTDEGTVQFTAYSAAYVWADGVKRSRPPPTRSYTVLQHFTLFKNFWSIGMILFYYSPLFPLVNVMPVCLIRARSF